MGSSVITEHARQVHSVLDSLREGVPASASLVTRSWQRCVESYGLDPERSHEPVVLDGDQLRLRQERAEGLICRAEEEMVNLYQQLAGSGFAIFLADIDGAVLKFIGDPLFSDIGAKTSMIPGAIWDERHQGTNGIGTCLAEGRPVLVHCDDHFFAGNIGLTCSGAPIFDPQGKLIAVLDASSQSRLAQQHTLALVNMSAQLLENRLFMRQFDNELVLRFHSRPEFVNTLGEGLLAFTADGRLLASNRSAKFQLGLGPEGLPLATDIRELFNVTMGGLIDRGAHDWYHPVPIHAARNGSRFFAILYQSHRRAQTVAEAIPVSRRGIIPSGRPQATWSFDTLEFGDPVMAEYVRRAKRTLNIDIPVTIIGETGTGKEVFAKTLHYSTMPADSPFVAVNCAAIPETLIESELFGYRPGAFTGASREGKRGKIQQANGGTLFLDEIGDMPLPLQSRLLRVLEEREVVLLGSETAIKVEFRLISATHRNLADLVAAGSFREDLYYRLLGLTIKLPALRERQDKRALIQHVLAQENQSGEPIEFEKSALRALEQYAWPGNVRELRSVLRCLLAMCETNRITLNDLPPEIVSRTMEQAPISVQPAEDEDEAASLNPLEAAMRECLLKELENHGWNVSAVAQQFKISRNALYRKMRRLNIQWSAHEHSRH